MILLLLMGCVSTVLYMCGDIIICLVLVKFGLVVSLPGGLGAQYMSANLQSATTASANLSTSSQFMMVRSTQTLCFNMR